jgi:hypothetical protein
MFSLTMNRINHLPQRHHAKQTPTSSTPIARSVFCAGGPHAMNTTPAPLSPSRLTTARSAAVVSSSHPFFWCEFALCARTVRTAFSQRTPACARRVRSLTPSAPSVNGAAG